MAKYILGGYVPNDIVVLTRTIDAIRKIRRLAVEPITKKKLLAMWFQQHERAATTEGAKRQAYLDLLGQDFYTKLRG